MKKIKLFFLSLISALLLSSCTWTNPYLSQTKTSSDDTLEFKRTDFNDSLLKNGPMTTASCPSTGDVNILVVPVSFKGENATDDIIEKVKLAFNGTKEQTGWYSVKEYYQVSSYEKLNFNFEIIDNWFTPCHDVAYYENLDTNSQDGLLHLINEVLVHYDNLYDYKNYDSDENGYIDGVWLINNLECDSTSSSFYRWALTSVYEKSSQSFDGVYSMNFCIANYDFMDVKQQRYNTDNLIVDAHTYIHETGHLLGLDDYYDTDNNLNTQSLYYADMMDYNMGDHGPHSKLLLNWIDPIVVTGSGTKEYNLNDFSTSADVLVFANHDLTSIYDEFYILEYYTQTGCDSDIPIKLSRDTEPRGIRVYHVNMEKSDTVNSYGSYFKYDNTNTSCMFASVLRASTSTEIHQMTTQDLFRPTSLTFSQLYGNSTLDDGSMMFFDFSVDFLDDGYATITVTKD